MAGAENLVPFPKGVSGNPGGLTKRERWLKDAIDEKCVPAVMEVLDALKAAALSGDVAAARLWLEQVRPIAKASQQNAVDTAVRARFEELISEARRKLETRQLGVVETEKG